MDISSVSKNMFQPTLIIWLLLGFSSLKTENRMQEGGKCGNKGHVSDNRMLGKSRQSQCSNVPGRITFKTDFKMSQKLVNFIGSKSKAFGWLDEVQRVAQILFNHQSLDTKVTLKITSKQVSQIDVQANNWAFQKLTTEKKQHALGFFGTSSPYGQTLGIALMSSACTREALYVVEYRRSTQQVGATLAHEIAHVIGMDHNGYGCQGGNLMNANGDDTSIGWTGCNNREFKYFYRRVCSCF